MNYSIKPYQYLLGKKTMFPKTYDERYQEYEIKNVQSYNDNGVNKLSVFLESSCGFFNAGETRLEYDMNYFKQNWVITRRLQMSIREVSGVDKIVVSVDSDLVGKPTFVFSGVAEKANLRLHRTTSYEGYKEMEFEMDRNIKSLLLDHKCSLIATMEFNGIRYLSNTLCPSKVKSVLSR